MAYLEVGGVALKTPSVFNISTYDISEADSGRTLDGLMHSNKLRDGNGNIVKKTTIEVEWWMCTPAEAQSILTALEANEYFSVKYYDPHNGTTQVTKTFYLGDRETPVKMWTLANKRYESISTTLIER